MGTATTTDGTVQYPGLRWTASQGFKTRELARAQQHETATYSDPARPGMAWVVKNVRRVGPGQWRADHYVVVSSLTCENGGRNAWDCDTADCERAGHAASRAARAERAARPVAMPGEHIAAGVARAEELRQASRCDGFETGAHDVAGPVALYPVPGGRGTLLTLCAACHGAYQAFWSCGIPAQCPVCRCCSLLDTGCSSGTAGRCHAAPAPVAAQDAPAELPGLTARERHELGLMARAMGTPVSELLETVQGRQASPVAVPELPACPGCADRPCDGRGRFPGGRVCRWCQEAGSCPAAPDDAPAPVYACDVAGHGHHTTTGAAQCARNAPGLTGSRLAARAIVQELPDGRLRFTPDPDDVRELREHETTADRARCHRAGHHLSIADPACDGCQDDARALSDAFPAERAAIRPCSTGRANIPGRQAGVRS